MTLLQQDKQRYPDGKMPSFQRYWRRAQEAKRLPGKMIYRLLAHYAKRRRHIDMPNYVNWGGGAYFGHAYGITVNGGAVLGRNVNIHKGATIGQQNRGEKAGAPVIGDNVWIGINAAIVGNVHIGNDVLIAPNSYVNCDIPDHSLVFGNPCIIKHREHATQDYLNHCIDL